MDVLSGFAAEQPAGDEAIVRQPIHSRSLFEFSSAAPGGTAYWNTEVLARSRLRSVTIFIDLVIATENFWGKMTWLFEV